MRTALWIALLLAISACDGVRSPDVDADTTSVADTLARYVADSLAWFREGRRVEYGGREWQPAGRPIEIEREKLQRVGDFERMELYAAKEEAPSPRHLLFPLSDGRWQALEPVDSVKSPD